MRQIDVSALAQQFPSVVQGRLVAREVIHEAEVFRCVVDRCGLPPRPPWGGGDEAWTIYNANLSKWETCAATCK